MDQRDYWRRVASDFYCTFCPDRIGEVDFIDFNYPVRDVRIEKGTRLAGFKDPRVSPLRTTFFCIPGTPVDILGVHPVGNLKTNPKAAIKVRERARAYGRRRRLAIQGSTSGTLRALHDSISASITASCEVGATMANYALLRRGDKLPAVGVLQKLLNRGGARLNVDGDFGSTTQNAVFAFQRARGLASDGAVGQNTWPRVSAYANLPIVDCVDIFDRDLADFEARDIRNAGGTPLLVPGMSNGVQEAVEAILAAAPRNVFLLRFHGHGAPGIAGFSDGEGVGSGHRSDVSPQNLREVLPIIGRLRPIFGPYGCVQFMHCRTGRGASGRTVLSAIANRLGVPVSAGVQGQLGGGLDTFRFEGPTVTLLPGSLTLSAWASGRPDFAAMTVV